MPEIKLSPEVVQNYFAQLNPIAQRIASDINETKENYGQLWYSLSYSEQNDVINETIIRPDLSLRYFDNFSSTSSISSASSSRSSCDLEPSASADSLAAVVLKNINDSLERNEGKSNKTQDLQKHIEKTKNIKKSHNSMRQYYSYDGRNLRTFGTQKVALKIIQDDVLGAYRDEHSMPFSYRTKSQMNLHLFTDEDNEKKMTNEIKDDEVCLINSKIKTTRESHNLDIPKHDQVSIENYKKLQNELKFNLRRDSKDRLLSVNDTKGQNISTAIYERLDNQKSINNVSLPLKSHKIQMCNRPQVKPPPAPINTINTNGNNKKSIIVDCKNLQSSTEQRYKSYLNSNATSSSSTTSISYAVYSDAYYDHSENTNLMQNFGSSHGSGILTASSSSAATSDDDDEKTLCEEVKLLDNDANLRKGFDFLNNW